MELVGARVLDLFAGSGALGLEAISRGAAQTTFVESDPRVLAIARENAADLDVETQCRFSREDALGFLQRYDGPPFALVLADPPYHLPSIALLPDLAMAHLATHGLLVLEHDARIRMDHHPLLETSRTYGRTVVSIFEAPAMPVDGEEPTAPNDEEGS